MFKTFELVYQVLRVRICMEIIHPKLFEIEFFSLTSQFKIKLMSDNSRFMTFF